MRIDTTYACITGLGFISSIGNDTKSVVQNLRDQRSGVRPHRFLGAEDRSSVHVAGVIDGFNFEAPSWAGWQYPAGFSIPHDTLRALSPHGVYAYCAVEQALHDAKLTRAEFSTPRIGLFCASIGSPMLMHRYLGQLFASKGRRGPPLGIVSSIPGTLNFVLSAHYQIEGVNTGFVSACASSAHAIGYALDEIRLGRQDAVMIVGAEEFAAESALPFAAMNALSRQTGTDASCPWDIRRDGFVPTGGACALLIESPEFAKRRGAQPMARITGWGQSSDGVDKTSSHPEGAGLSRAMSNALADTGVAANKVDYVNAHATSTKVGDISEAHAITDVFSNNGHNPLVSSVKGITGHSLSMSGALEAAFCTKFLEQGFYSGNAHLKTRDPACLLLNLPKTSAERALNVILSNSSGFGGSNVSIVLESA
jgi:3-oxoacyl-[acyl-carrier-protein] synthase-1